MKLSDITTKLAELATLKRTAADELTKVRARISKAVDEIEALNCSPLPRFDVEAAMRADIGVIRRKITTNPANREWIEARATRPMNISMLIANSEPEGAFDLIGELQEPAGAVYLLFSDDEIMAALKPIFDASDWKTPGPSLADRRKRRAALQAELAELRQAEADLTAAVAIDGRAPPTPALDHDTEKTFTPGGWVDARKAE